MKAALSKLKSEISKDKTPYVQVVGNFLLQHLESDPSAAEKIAAEGKTIAGSLAYMRDEAQKHRVGNVAVLTDQDGFASVLRYFGIGIEAVSAIETAEETFDFLD